MSASRSPATRRREALLSLATALLVCGALLLVACDSPGTDAGRTVPASRPPPLAAEAAPVPDASPASAAIDGVAGRGLVRPEPGADHGSQPAAGEPGGPAHPVSGLFLRERRGTVMGTSMLLEALGPDPALLEVALAAAEAELRRVEDLMTDWRASPLMELNASAGRGAVAVPAELAQMIDQALRIAEASGGAFDPTWLSVGQLWDWRAEPPVVPDEQEIAAALRHVGHRLVQVDLAASTVSLPAGTLLGLGGIAKGYGVDRAMAVLREHGVEHGAVEAGGDLKLLGRKHGALWQIAVRHPRRPGSVLAVLPVSNTCVLTSGDYERFFELDGVRYHHILDPRTGRPATGCISATVIGPEASLADGIATALCVLGPERGLAWIETLDGVEALVVGLDGEVHRSSGL
jgi:thiamine biosynthesis lipoprotein